MQTTPDANGDDVMRGPDMQQVPAVLRALLIDNLRLNDALHNAEVERAMRIVPRHLFLPSIPPRDAYADIAVPTHWQDNLAISSASQPAMVSIMLEQLAVSPGMRVLEIGAGTGYNAALLAELVGPTGSVTTLDIDIDIVEEAVAHLTHAGYTHVEAIATDGAVGWRPGAPYDRIILTVGASDITPDWFEQLVDGGIIVLPLWLGGVEASIAFRKHDGVLESESLALCGFMRLRGQEASEDQLTTLANGRRIFGERIAEASTAVDLLLASRPRRLLWQRANPSFIQYLGLRGYRLFTLFPRPPKNPRASRPGRWGIYVAQDGEPSLALFSYRLPVVIVFGSMAAWRIVENEWGRWQQIASAPLEQWHITAHPRADDEATPPHMLRLMRHHFVFDIDMAPNSSL
ncbi:MAG: methyltransferase domain-containing protein [Ktedonobacterales bacterium]